MGSAGAGRGSRPSSRAGGNSPHSFRLQTARLGRVSGGSLSGGEKRRLIMYCNHRRPLETAVRAIIHKIRILTVLVMVAGRFGTSEMLGGVVRASGLSASEMTASEAAATSEITGGCSVAGLERQRLRVRLVPAKDLTEAMIAPVQQEVVELWRPYGVDIVWEEMWNEGDPRSKPDLFVFFVNRELEATRPGATPVAWILFVDGTPRELINVSVSAARRLMSATPWHDERPIRLAPLSAQERLLGRMIGRALAHEIGHYLLASSRHAREGLMKPMITPDEFVKEGRKHLKLVQDDERALRTSRLAGCQLTASR